MLSESQNSKDSALTQGNNDITAFTKLEGALPLQVGGKIGGNKLLQSLSSIPHKVIDPLLSRLNAQTLNSTFENELSHCLKSCYGFNDSHPNSSKLLCVASLSNCWEKFLPYLPPDYIAVRIVEVGELLLGLPHFTEVAYVQCFAFYVEKIQPFVKDASTTDDTALLHQVLSLRCRIGQALSIYLRVLKKDPKLMAHRSISSVMEVLETIQSVMEECTKNERLAWLLCNCSFHIHTIVTFMMTECSYLTEGLPYILWCVLCFEHMIPFQRPEHIKWRLEFYLIAANVYLKAGAVKESAEILTRAEEKYQVLLGVFRESIGISKDLQDIFDMTFSHICFALYQCDIFSLSKSELRSVDLIKGSPLGDLAQYSSSDSVPPVHHRLAYPKFSNFVSDAARIEWEGVNVANFYSQVLSRPSFPLLLSSPDAKPRHQWTKKSLISMQEAKKRMTAASTSLGADDNLVDLFDSPHDPTRNAVSPVDDHEASNNPNAKRLAKRKRKPAAGYGARADDKIREKERGLLASEELHFLIPATSDADKLHAICVAIRALLPSSTYKNTAHDLIDHQLQFAFDLLTSLNNQFLSGSHGIDDVLQRLEGGKFVTEIELEELAATRRISQFEPADFSEICHYLQMFRKSHFLTIVLTLFNREISLSSQSTVSAVDILPKVQQAKCSLFFAQLAFQEAVTKAKAETTVNTPQYLIPEMVQSAIHKLFVALERFASLAFHPGRDTPQYRYETIYFDAQQVPFMEAAQLCAEVIQDSWDIVSGVMKDCNYLIEQEVILRTANQNPFVLDALRFMFVFLATYIPGYNITLTCNVGCRFALFLECASMFEESLSVLKTTQRRLDRNRVNNGVSLDSVTSFSSLPSFTSDTKRAVSHDQNESVIVSELGGSFDKDLNAHLSCLSVDILAAIYRCNLRLEYSRIYTAQQKERDLAVRLSHRKLPANEPVLVDMPNATLYESLCGQNPLHMAILNIVYSGNVAEFSHNQRLQLLKDAADFLRQAMKVEANLASQRVSSRSVKKFQPPKTGYQDKIVVQKCPAPLIVSRSRDTVTISPNPIIIDSVEVQPAYYEVYCKAIRLGNVAMNDNEFLGTGLKYPFVVSTTPFSGVLNEYTVTGLSANERYAFALVAYEKNGDCLCAGIGEPSVGVITCLPDSLLLAWGYLGHVANAAECHEISSEATNVMMEYFVPVLSPVEALIHPCSASRTGSNHPKVHELNIDGVLSSPKGITKTFIQAIFSEVDRERIGSDAEVYSDNAGTREVKLCQTNRLISARFLMIAIEVCVALKDPVLSLVSIIKCFHILHPLLEHEVSCSYIVHIFCTCHDLLRQLYKQLGSDYYIGLDELFAPITFYLIRHFMEFKEYLKVMQLVDQSMQVLEFCHVLRSSLTDSTSLENQWLGSSSKKMKKSNMTHFKTNYSADNFYHARLATTKNVDTGLVTGNGRPIGSELLPALSEFMESTINSSRTKLLPFLDSYLEMIDSEKSEGAVTESTSYVCTMMSLPKKGFEGNFSIGHFYHLIQAHNIEFIFGELSKFRKDPRYYEFAARLLEHGFTHGAFSLVVKVSTELEDWVDKRNQCILLFDNIIEERIDSTTSETNIKRHYRPIFIVRDIEKDFKNAKASAVKNRKTNATKVHLPSMRGVTRGVKGSNLSVFESGPVKEGKAPQKIMQEQEVISEESENGSMSPLIPSEKPDIFPHVPTTAEISAIPELMKDKSALEDKDTTVTAKRRRQAHRQAFYAGLSAEKKDLYERSIKVLDQRLGSLWRQVRYRRRLRAVLEVEREFKSRSLMYHGLAIFAQIELAMLKVGLSKSNASSYIYDGLQDFRISGLLSNAFQQEDSIELSQIFGYDVNMFREGYEALIKSVVTAARGCRWLQMLEGVRYIWNVTRMLLSHNLLQAKDGWKDMLHRVFSTTADYLLDMLASADIFEAENEDPITVKTPISRPTTTSCRFTPYLSENSDMKRLDSKSDSSKRSEGPVRFDVHAQKKAWCMRWTDHAGLVRVKPLDVGFCSDFLLFSIETLHVAKKTSRLTALVSKFCVRFKHAVQLSYLELDVNKNATTPSSKTAELTAECALLLGKYDRGKLVKNKETMKLAGEMLDEKLPRLYSLAVYEKDANTVAYAAFKLGNLEHDRGNAQSACHHWNAGLDFILGKKNASHEWRNWLAEIDPIFKATDKNKIPGYPLIALCGGANNLMLASLLVLRLAKYSSTLDNHVDMSSFAMILIGALCLDSIGSFAFYSDYVHSPIRPKSLSPALWPNSELMESKSMLMSLFFGVSSFSQFGDSANAHLALPVLAFAAYINAEFSHDIYMGCSIKLLQMKVISGLGYIKEAFEVFQSVITGEALVGVALPSLSCIPLQTKHQPREENEHHIAFSNALPFSNDTNIAVMRGILSQKIPDHISAYYGPELINRIELEKCDLLLTIIAQVPELYSSGIDFNSLYKYTDATELLLRFEDKQQNEPANEEPPENAQPQSRDAANNSAAPVVTLLSQERALVAQMTLAKIESTLWSISAEIQPKLDGFLSRASPNISKKGSVSHVVASNHGGLVTAITHCFKLYSLISRMAATKGNYSECLKWITATQNMLTLVYGVEEHIHGKLNKISLLYEFHKQMGGISYSVNLCAEILSCLYAKGKFVELLEIISGAAPNTMLENWKNLWSIRPWLKELYRLKCLYRLGRTAEALAHIKLLKIKKDILPIFSEDKIRLYQVMGQICAIQKQIEPARGFFSSSYHTLLKTFALSTTEKTFYSKFNALSVEIFHQYAIFEQELGDIDKAQALVGQSINAIQESVLLHPSLIASVCLTYAELHSISSISTSEAQSQARAQDWKKHYFLGIVLLSQHGYQVLEIRRAILTYLLAEATVNLQFEAGDFNDELLRLTTIAAHASKAIEAYHRNTALASMNFSSKNETESNLMHEAIEHCRVDDAKAADNRRAALEVLMGARKVVFPRVLQLAHKDEALPCHFLLQEPEDAPSTSKRDRLQLTSAEITEYLKFIRDSQGDSSLVAALSEYANHLYSTRSRALLIHGKELHTLLQLQYGSMYTDVYCMENILELLLQPEPLHSPDCGFFQWLPTNTRGQGKISEHQMPNMVNLYDRVGLVILDKFAVMAPLAAELYRATVFDEKEQGPFYAIFHHSPIGDVVDSSTMSLASNSSNIMLASSRSHLKSVPSSAATRRTTMSRKGASPNKAARLPRRISTFVRFDGRYICYIRELLVVIHMNLVKSEWSSQPLLRKEAEILWTLIFHSIALYFTPENEPWESDILPAVPHLTLEHADGFKRLMDCESLVSWGALRDGMPAELTRAASNSSIFESNISLSSSSSGRADKKKSAERGDAMVRSIFDWISAVAPVPVVEGGVDSA